MAAATVSSSVVDDLGARHRQAGRVQQPVGQALVRGDVHPDRRGPRRHRRADPLLVDAMPELDEGMAVEADERDVAADRLVDEGLGRRPERLAFGEADQPLELRREVEEDLRVVGCDEVVDQGDGHLPGLEADLLLAVFEDAVVLAGRAGRPGLAVADVGPGEVLELQGDVLGDVADPGAVAQPADEAPASPQRAGVVLERRQERDEGVGEVRELVRRVLLQDAQVHEHPDDRLARPVVGAAQDAGLEDPQGRRGPSRSGNGRPGPGRARSAALGAGRGCGLGHGTPSRSTAWDDGPDRRAGLAGRGLAAGQGVQGLATSGVRDDAGRSGSRPAANGARPR